MNSGTNVILWKMQPIKIDEIIHGKAFHFAY